MKPSAESSSLWSRKSIVQDCLFISLIVSVSVSLYIHGLGFYSDDWDALARFSLSKDESFNGLFRVFYAPQNVWMRPVQAFYLTTLYWLFGLHPLGYHLTNAVVLASCSLLLYLVLSELGQQRILALSGSMVYALLPHYSTDRFWFIAFQAGLSIAFYFLSLYADLRGLRVHGGRLWGWKILSILSLILSTLAYEAALPLFLLNPLLVWYRSKQLGPSELSRHPTRAHMAILLVPNLVMLIAVVIFKVLVTTRLGSGPASFPQIVWIIKSALAVNYGFYGFHLPSIVWTILSNCPNREICAVGGVVGLVVFGYCYHLTMLRMVELPNRTDTLRFIIGGSVVFGLGYAIFLVKPNMGFTATGIINRISIAAAVGVALTQVGILGWVSTFLPSDLLRKLFFCMLIALSCTSGYLINNVLALFWIESYRQQQSILIDIREHFPTLPAESNLILDGVCPYNGPAIVFDSSWDLQGALRLIYRDEALRANVVTPNMQVGKDGLYTLEHRRQHWYPYEKLFVYNFARKESYQLANAEAARLYFRKFNPDHSNGCPSGEHEIGVPVFN